MFKKFAVALFIVSLLATVGCLDSTRAPRADEKIPRQQEQMQQNALSQTGMPGITNFTELKILRHLYELRDQSISTFTYIPDLNGRLWHLCDSVGFGLPYATQFSNPEKNVWTDGEGYHAWVNTNLPQAEPNGLYMPSSAEGTWVMCGSDKGTQPVYVEPRIIVSTIRLRAEGEYAVK